MTKVNPMVVHNLKMQAGLNFLSVTHASIVSFVDPETAEVCNVFSVSPGRHVLRVPSGVEVMLDTFVDCQYRYRARNRFNPFDAARIEAPLIRPRTQKEELQEYLNELAARATGEEMRQALRSGQAVFDPAEEDYSEDHEDDYDSPLSVHQMSLIMEELQADIARAKELRKSDPQLDIEDEIDRHASLRDSAIESSPAPADSEKSKPGDKKSAS